MSLFQNSHSTFCSSKLNEVVLLFFLNQKLAVPFSLCFTDILGFGHRSAGNTEHLWHSLRRIHRVLICVRLTSVFISEAWFLLCNSEPLVEQYNWYLVFHLLYDLYTKQLGIQNSSRGCANCISRQRQSLRIHLSKPSLLAPLSTYEPSWAFAEETSGFTNGTYLVLTFG